ncbi:hypothetical protein CBS101457_001102 [Exobasidium rhododendri]|nr:hypothetical protein CBS101457_001102 [Exobasidium rhododendri]
MAIRAALIFNNHGKPRLTRFYSQLPISRQQALIQRIFALVHKRTVENDGRELCNFLDAPELRALLPPPSNRSREVGSNAFDPSSRPSSGKDKSSVGENDQLRVIYRHYATLYFVFVVDESESELGILDLIQVFVESLDRCFENVCELDLIFHFDEVHAILNEIIQGGLVLETNINDIVTSVQLISRARKASVNSTGAHPSIGAGVGSGLEGGIASWTQPTSLGGLPWSEAAANVGGWARTIGNKLAR